MQASRKLEAGGRALPGVDGDPMLQEQQRVRIAARQMGAAQLSSGDGNGQCALAFAHDSDPERAASGCVTEQHLIDVAPLATYLHCERSARISHVKAMLESRKRTASAAFVFPTVNGTTYLGTYLNRIHQKLREAPKFPPALCYIRYVTPCWRDLETLVSMRSRL